MSLDHRFYNISKDVINKERIPIEDKIVHFCFEKVKISDNIILYIFDTLKWIPSFNISKSINCFGLNYYGITLFKENGIEELFKIIDAWLNLFNNAPTDFELRGNYVINEDQTGNYEKLKFQKVDLLEILNSFKFQIKMAIRNDLFIIHFGI